jgi:hypothetical protein
MSSRSELFAPPKASLEASQGVGTLVVEGDLVRMQRGGRLPDRCVTCGAPAPGERLARNLTYVKTPIRLAVWGVPLTILLVGMFGGFPEILLFFWPVALIAWAATLILRRRIALDTPICVRHAGRRRWYLRLAVVSMLVVAAMIALLLLQVDAPEIVGVTMLIAVIALGLLGVIDGMSGWRRVAVARMDRDHVWLKRTGAGFRDALRAAGSPNP